MQRKSATSVKTCQMCELCPGNHANLLRPVEGSKDASNMSFCSLALEFCILPLRRDKSHIKASPPRNSENPPTWPVLQQLWPWRAWPTHLYFEQPQIRSLESILSFLFHVCALGSQFVGMPGNGRWIYWISCCMYFVSLETRVLPLGLPFLPFSPFQLYLVFPSHF